jgi:hypothetical protein
MSVRDAWLQYRANLAAHFNMSSNEVDAMIKQQDPETLFCAGYHAMDKRLRDFALGMNTDNWVVMPKFPSTAQSHSRETCHICKRLDKLSGKSHD